jgi:hypothetical protein
MADPLLRIRILEAVAQERPLHFLSVRAGLSKVWLELKVIDGMQVSADTMTIKRGRKDGKTGFTGNSSFK